jgi:hypothetical protein
VREAATAAAALGLNVDTVQAQIREQMASMGGGMGGMGGGGNGQRGNGPAAGTTPNVSRGEVMLASNDQGGQQPGGAGRQRGQMPDVSDKDCEAVKTAFAKHPDAEQKLASIRTRVQSGELDFQASRAESQKIYETVGVDARIAGACRMRERQRAGGGDSAAPRGARQAGGNAERPAGNQGGSDRAATPDRGGVSTPVQAGEFPARRARPSLVFVAENGGYKARIVRLGVGNFDYTEVVSGLKEGEQVALLAAAAMQARREEQNNRMRNMGGMPGMSTPRPGAGGAGAPGGGGNANRGGGGRP